MVELVYIEHPISSHLLSHLRNKRTNYYNFRQSLDRLSYVLAVYLYSSLNKKEINLKTPLSPAKGVIITNKVVLVPILRAGVGLLKGFLDLFPEAIVSHIGIYREETTLKPVRYYFKYPRIKNKKSIYNIVLDPMIATGGSMIDTIQQLKNRGLKNIFVASLLCAPEGIKALSKAFPEKDFKIRIFTFSVDKNLNNKGYIVPGLGDAGDRYFGT
ncbi:MAG: uracil phosphoribosyltransferase [Ignavibacteria bacterium]|nr:uracil phosphoribosyltransferase [Ignavibacteria bacterium]